MGHRDDLLAGAKRCLYEKGYARTTARDIVAASGTNLASIGYHFGSKAALLTAALLDAWAELDEQLRAVTLPAGGVSSYDQVEAAFRQQIEQWRSHWPLVLAQVEALAQARHLPEVRERLAASYERARQAGAEYLLSLAGDRISAHAARAFVSHQIALTDGVMLQYLLDPERAPTAPDVVAAERVIVKLFSGFEAGERV